MKIFIIFRNTFPFGMAPSQHIACEALGLKASGADLEVIIFSPPFDRGTDNGLPNKGSYRGIPYEYIHGKNRPSNILLQLLNRFWNTIKTFFWGLKHYKEGDVVYCYGGDNLTLLLFTWAVHIRKAKIVIELVEIPFYDKSLLSRIRRLFCKTIILSHIDAFVCISHALLDFVKKYNRNNVPMLLLPILVEEYEGQLDLQTRFDVPYIIHTGTMNEQKDGISYILKGFAEFKKSDNSNCRLVFTGPDANKEFCKYRKMISDLGIDDSVDLLGMIASRNELLGLQKNAKMSIVYKVDNIQTRYCFATKIGELLIAGVPLITTDVGEQEYYLKNEESAIIVKARDEYALSRAIHFLLENPERARQVGAKGKNVAQTDFNPIVQGMKLKLFFDSL